MFDSARLTLFVILYISIGIIFHAGLRSVIGKLQYVQHLVFIGTAIIIGTLLFIFLSAAKRNQFTKQNFQAAPTVRPAQDYWVQSRGAIK